MAQHTYSQNYPALPQVRNNDIPTATAVQAGNPVRIRDWKAAENEYKKRKTARINGAPVVRAAEVTAAKLRKDSLEHEVIQMTYGGNVGAPVWALLLHSKLDSLSSKLDNLRLMEFNRHQQHNYRPKYKQFVGCGIDNQNLVPPDCNVVVIADDAIPPVGTSPLLIGSPGGVFPISREQAQELPYQSVVDLMYWYHEDFGILQNDSLPQRCLKIILWIQGEY